MRAAADAPTDSAMTPPVSISPLVRLIAWLGGVAFVVALAVGAWTFGVVLAQPAPGHGWHIAAIAWNVTLFTVFAGHHSLMARSGAKAWVARHTPPVLERSLYVWVASLLFLGVSLGWQRVPGVVYSASGWLVVVLAAMQGAGLVMTAAGARVLDALDLAGIRQVVGPPRADTIQIVWPYTLVRHPIYLGWVLLVWAASPMTVDRLVWAVVSTTYLVIAMPWEERSLSAAVGPAYAAYCRQVRWRLVPGLY